MKRMLFLIVGIICICIFVLYKHNQNHYEDKGVWIKLSENIPEGGYILHNNYIYGCYLDTLIDIKRVSPLEGVDVSSFEVCKGTDYARDKNRVYYPILIIAVDGEDFGYSYFKEYVLRKDCLFGLFSIDVDPKSFKYLGDGFATDGNTMFRYGQK